jgi:lysophospholipase L1-like esterase
MKMNQKIKNLFKNASLLMVLFTLQSPCIAKDFGKILCLGDSITGGGGGVFGYREQLAKLMVNDTYQFVGPLNWGVFSSVPAQNIHAGFGGWSTRHLLESRVDDPRGEVSTWLRDSQPDTIVFSAGTNDIWDMTNGFVWNFFAQRLIHTLMYARYTKIASEAFTFTNRNVKLIMFSPPRRLSHGVGSYYYNFNRKCGQVMKQVVYDFKQRGYDITFVDVWSQMSDTNIYTVTDGIHINNLGASVIAKSIYQELH